MGAGGERGSFNSGIVSCTVPFTLAELGPSSDGGSGLMPFVLSVRVCFGDPETSDARGVEFLEESLRNGETGRFAFSPASRSLALPFPKPLKAEPRLEDDFPSGEEALP